MIDDDLFVEEKIIKVSPPREAVLLEQKTQVIQVNPSDGATRVVDAGPVGPSGVGEKGDPGDAAAQPIYVESPGSVSVWEIEHPFDGNPDVSLYFMNDTQVLGFPLEFSPGKATIDISPLSYVLKAKLKP